MWPNNARNYGDDCYTYENSLKELCKLYGSKKRTAMEKARFLSLKIEKKSIDEFGARFLRQSQILIATGGLSDLTLQLLWDKPSLVKKNYF